MNRKAQKKVVRPLGSYVAERHPAAAANIDASLRSQHALATEGGYQPLGAILSEQHGVEPGLLESCLMEQRADALGVLRLFEALPREALEGIAENLTNDILPAGALVFSEAEPGEFYYVVISGSVRIFRREQDGEEITVAVRGPGEGFGEISLLTDEPHFSYAQTLERTSLLRLPKETFLDAVFAHPDAARACARILAERLRSGYGRIADEIVAGEAYRQFIADHLRKEEPLLMGNSATVMKLIGEIEQLAVDDRPVLVTGEPGTELRDAAGLIHEMSRTGAGMFLTLDAKTCDDAGVEGRENDPLYLELNQTAALFGRGRNALPFAPDRRLGLLFLADGGTLAIENVECLAPRVQRALADYLDRGTFRAVGEAAELTSDVRIVATTHADLHALAAQGGFESRLSEALAGRIIVVPPLRRRKRDIMMTAEELLRRTGRQTGKTSVRGIDDEARLSLLRYDWPGNGEELRVVIRRAVSVCRGEELSVEDIFLSPPPVTGKVTFNLLGVGPVARMLKSRFYPRISHVVTIPFILLIAGSGLFGPQEPDRNLALVLTWAFWEPLLVFGAFFLGRAWCSVCPLGGVSMLVRDAAGLNRKVPALIREYGYYFTAAGIAVIFWAEAATHMTVSPRASALLLLPLVALAALAGLLYQRRAWCRYLCPLGGMVGVLASSAIVEMRANYAVCNSTCEKHECYSGTESRDGCPMFEGPFALNSNRTCVLCATCVKVCPNHSPVLNLRLPGHELWTLRSPDRAFTAIAVALFATQLFRGMEGVDAFGLFRAQASPAGMLALMAAAVLCAATLTFAAGRFAFGSGRAGTEREWQFMAYALVPLLLGFEAAFHMERLLRLGGQVLTVAGRQFGFGADLPGFSIPHGGATVVQVLLLLIGAAGSAGVIAARLYRQERLTLTPAFLVRIFWIVPVVALTDIVLLISAA